METTHIRSWSILTALMLLMALTRFNHFGTNFALPDASLAVFFLAGLYLARTPLVWAVLPLLLLEAGLIDYYAVTFGGVSDWCLTPAYWGLIPTYALMWLTGKLCAPQHALRLAALGRTLLFAGAATSLAFAVSNLTFYWFSGRYENIHLAEYGMRIADYFLPYVLVAIFYVAAAFGLEGLMKQTRKNPARTAQ